MAITDPMVLPADVVLVPVSDLPSAVQERLAYDPGDYALTRPRSRVPSKIVDAEAAALIGQFRQPSTIVQAVIQYSRERSGDPQKTLEEAFPLIQGLMQAGLLVDSNSATAKTIEYSLEAGAHIGRYTARECVQVLEDTEVYFAQDDDGQSAALKLARAGERPALETIFTREAGILKHLDGEASPALKDEGTWEGRRYLALEWCQGISPVERAGGLRLGGDAERRGLLSLCRGIVRAYAHLHAQNVLHGDIHPGNVLVDDHGTVKIVDYGLARIEGAQCDLGLAPRGGVPAFFEPEYAVAVRGGKRPPQTSRAGEQYAVAALVYLVLTGNTYCDFSIERESMFEQIIQEPPRAFAKSGLAPWPEVEAILARALSKNPSDRFASLDEMGEHLDAIAASEPTREAEHGTSKTHSESAALEDLRRETLRRLSLEGPLLPTGITAAPTASINYGAAGVAYGLYHIACATSDAALLSLADVWATRALQEIGKPTAFHNAEIEVTPEVVGPISLFHSPSGVHLVRALIAQALGDLATHAQATHAFIEASRGPCENLDLTLGRSSTLLGCALLLDVPTSNAEVNKALREFGGATLTEIWDRVGQYAPVRECREMTYLGIAHGWAGLLYAALLWRKSSGALLPDGFDARLEQLAELAQPAGRGVRWTWMAPSVKADPHYSYMPGWCNGSAGHTHLWTLAHQVLGDARWLDLAERVAWDTSAGPDSIGNLCCGAAGQAYALLHMYRHSGDKEWLARARALASGAPKNVQAMRVMRDSLYKGETGIAVLATDLEAPERAAMPCFEPQGWPKG